MEVPPPPSSSISRGGEVTLVARKGGWGLPTACPSCLPVFAYLTLANARFDLHHNSTLPDSDDLPFIEFDNVVGYASETGGAIGFLKEHGIADLDSGFSESEVAQIRSYGALVTSWLHEAVLYEIWVAESKEILEQVYFESIPWPVNKVLTWKQHMLVSQRLGINSFNKHEKEGEIYQKAAEAYGALSAMLGENKYFLTTRPCSLDALYIGHALFIMQAPLGNSRLKEELMKHNNLVNCAQSFLNEFILGEGSSRVSGNPSLPSRAGAESSSKRAQASPSTKTTKEPAQPKVRTDREKRFRRRAKLFLGAQFCAVLLYLFFTGVVYEELLFDGDDEDDE